MSHAFIRLFIKITPLCLVVLSLIQSATAQDISARAAVRANSVYVGESFQFQIQVSGTESAEQPDLSAIQGFNVQPGRSGANSSSSTTIINGRMTRHVQKSFIYNYQLTATRPGRLTIPAITIKAEGKEVRTQPVTITATPPAEVENFKLRQEISKTQAYVGEALILELIFYYGDNVSDPQLTVPLISDVNFITYDLEDSDNKKVEQLDGKRFQTMRLRKVVIPKASGTFEVQPSTLAFNGADGFTYGRDFIGRRVKQPKYKRIVIPSNGLSLEILDVPEAGRPANFAGHIGEYTLSASASPTTVNVGDPITINIAISGPAYLEHVNLPALHQQASLTNDFRVPTEMEAGQVNGNFKVFTQTVRASSDRVTEIPPIELPYFDTASGTYQIAKSKAIAISVNPTKVVTASDAEGMTPTIGQTNEVEAWTKGIAYNYEDLDTLNNQAFDPTSWLRSPAYLGMLGMPPVAYLAMLMLVTSRRKRLADPAALRSRRALAELSSRLHRQNQDSNEVMDAFRTYLGDKLRLSSGALTFKDIQQPLQDRGVAEEVLAEIKHVFDQFEASRYAGDGNAEDAVMRSKRHLEIAKKLEKTLK